MGTALRLPCSPSVRIGQRSAEKSSGGKAGLREAAYRLQRQQSRATLARQEAEGTESVAHRMAARAAIAILDISVWLLGREGKDLLRDQLEQQGSNCILELSVPMTFTCCESLLSLCFQA